MNHTCGVYSPCQLHRHGRIKLLRTPGAEIYCWAPVKIMITTTLFWPWALFYRKAPQNKAMTRNQLLLISNVCGTDSQTNGQLIQEVLGPLVVYGPFARFCNPALSLSIVRYIVKHYKIFFSCEEGWENVELILCFSLMFLFCYASYANKGCRGIRKGFCIFHYSSHYSSSSSTWI